MTKGKKTAIGVAIVAALGIGGGLWYWYYYLPSQWANWISGQVSIAFPDAVTNGDLINIQNAVMGADRTDLNTLYTYMQPGTSSVTKSQANQALMNIGIKGYTF